MSPVLFAHQGLLVHCGIIPINLECVPISLVLANIAFLCVRYYLNLNSHMHKMKPKCRSNKNCTIC